MVDTDEKKLGEGYGCEFFFTRRRRNTRFSTFELGCMCVCVCGVCVGVWVCGCVGVCVCGVWCVGVCGCMCVCVVVVVCV